MISLKDYALQKNVSYEAVRKQVTRYKEDLEGHIIMDGRQQFLDDEAVAFLDAKRQKNPVVIYQASKDEEIAALKAEREQLIMKTAAQAERIAELTQFKLETIEARQALEASQAAQERRAQALREREAAIVQELATARQEGADAARAEAEKEKRLLEGFIQDAKKELATAQEEHQAALDQEREKHRKTVSEMSEEMGDLLLDNKAQAERIQALESRTLWDYLREWLFGRGE